jgi:hypothetical protein
MKSWWLLIVFMLLAVGCALTDQQINDIASAVQTGVETVAAPAISVIAPGTDAAGTGAAAGIASAIGLGSAFLVRWILTMIRKKPEA